MKTAILALALLTGACAGHVPPEVASNDTAVSRVTHHHPRTGPGLPEADLIIALQPGVPFNGCMVTTETRLGQVSSDAGSDCNTNLVLQFDRPSKLVAALRP